MQVFNAKLRSELNAIWT